MSRFHKPAIKPCAQCQTGVQTYAHVAKVFCPPCRKARRKEQNKRAENNRDRLGRCANCKEVKKLQSQKTRICGACYQYQRKHGKPRPGAIRQRNPKPTKQTDQTRCMCGKKAHHYYRLKTINGHSTQGYQLDDYWLCDGCYAEAKALENYVAPAPRPTARHTYITPGRYTVRVR